MAKKKEKSNESKFVGTRPEYDILTEEDMRKKEKKGK